MTIGELVTKAVIERNNILHVVLICSIDLSKLYALSPFTMTMS